MLNQIEFTGDIHDPQCDFFGYIIRESTDPDPYTDEDIENMIEKLNRNRIAKFPLQCLINIIKHLGGKCYWHETTSADDIEAYYSREMLEEMRADGFLYVSRIRIAADKKDALLDLDAFMTRKMREYSIGDINEAQGIYFNFCEDLQRNSPGLPRMNNSIIFSDIPVFTKDNENLMLPIAAEIIKLRNLERRGIEMEKRRDAAAINFLTQNGLSMDEAIKAVEDGKIAQYGSTDHRRR